MIDLDGSSLTLEQVDRIAHSREPVQLAPDAVTRMRASRAVVDRHLADARPVYGINTGFGALADVVIPHDQLTALQLNLLRSHAAGVGDPLEIPTVRALIALRANVLAKGFSGIRVEPVEALIALLNAGVHPVVPAYGSVGASGDLAPLAHLALVIVGEGEVVAPEGLRHEGHEEREDLVGKTFTSFMPSMSKAFSRMTGAEALAHAGLHPVTLGPKDGLALINGTQASTAVLALAVLAAGRLVRVADIAAAMSIDALQGSFHPFEARIHTARPVPGQAASADNLIRLIRGSALNASHAGCGRVQDAYAERCVPQVHGSAREALGFARRLVDIEANAATDNPMVFVDTGEIVSGGNFHGAPVGLAADVLAIGMAQLATISERRTSRLMTASESGLPAFLTPQSGLHSGLMMAHVTAAALASEIKTLSHPASVDTIPTSGGREDHVSMSMGAALKVARQVALAREVLAIELLAAVQAIDLSKFPTSTPLQHVHRIVRASVPPLHADRPPAPDMAAIASLIARGEIERAAAIELR